MSQSTDLLGRAGSGQVKQPQPNISSQHLGVVREQNKTSNQQTNTTGVVLTISDPSPEELNKGIVSAVQDYSVAKMRGDQQGMTVAARTAYNLRDLGGTASVPFERNSATPPRMIGYGSDDEEAWYNKDTGSVVITKGEDAGTVVVAPSRPNVAALNIRVENAKVTYFRAQILGDTKTMNEAAKEAELARGLGATLRADEDTALTASLKRYVREVKEVYTGINNRNTLDLNKGIVRLKNDYLYAKTTNDPVGMESARIMGDILRRLGGTIGSEVSLEDAKKMIEQRPTLPSPAPTPPRVPVDTSPKNAEIFDRVLGFVTGAGMEAGKGLLGLLQANADPLGTAIRAVHDFVVSLPVIYHAAVDWEDTVARIDGLLTEYRKYYETVPPFEKGQLEGEVITKSLFGIFMNKSVWIKNGKLATSVHPVSGVPFDPQGFPIFDAKFEARIPPEFYTAKVYEHKKLANEQLKKAIEENPELEKKFTASQLADIKNNKTPTDFVWHHHQETGRMQLVEQRIHADTGHTGGMAIWGRD